MAKSVDAGDSKSPDWRQSCEFESRSGHCEQQAHPLNHHARLNATRAALGYRPELDGLRAVAVLGVMVFHSGVALTGGFLGVDMFFVLSGFLITALLMEEWQTGGSISLRAFYARRAIRLLPALLGVLAVLWLAVLFLGDRFKTSPAIMFSTTGYTLGYMANWVMALHLDEWPTPLGHFWSLAVEEQFYLVWPVLLVTALTLRAPRWLPIAALSVAILAIGAWRAWLWRSGAGFDRVFYATDTHADGLLIGCLMALVLANAGPGLEAAVTQRARNALAMVGGALFVMGLVLLNNGASPAYFGGLTVMALAVAAVIGGLVAGPVPFLTAALTTAPAVWIGRRSYGLYLWHSLAFFAVLHVVRPPGALLVPMEFALSFICAYVSWTVLERPCLALKNRFGARKPATA